MFTYTHIFYCVLVWRTLVQWLNMSPGIAKFLPWESESLSLRGRYISHSILSTTVWGKAGFLFYRWENWGLGRWRKTCQVIQQFSSWARMETPPFLAPKSMPGYAPPRPPSHRLIHSGSHICGENPTVTWLAGLSSPPPSRTTPSSVSRALASGTRAKIVRCWLEI